MFTGIIEKTTPILVVEDRPNLRRLIIAQPGGDVKHGESIAINGVCLTVAQQYDGRVAFDVIQETLDKTNLGTLSVGDSVNLERSLRVGDRLDGHFVQGHVDGTAKLIEHRVNGDDWRTIVAIPPAMATYFVPKGSITIDGVSLTIASIESDRFSVALIPTTLQITTLGSRTPGWRFNLEADTMAKTVVRYLEAFAKQKAL